MDKGESEVKKDIEDLIQKLEKANYHWCTDVVTRLGEIGNEKAVDPLIKALEKGGETERIAAAEALGKISSKRAVDSLIKALEEGDMGERSMVAEALGKIGDARAVDPIIKLLEIQCNEGKVYYNVTDALASLGDEKAIEPLSKILENALSDAELCVHVVRNLAQIPSEQAIYAIIRALTDFRSPVVISPIAPPSVGDHAKFILKDIGKPAVVPLINTIASDDNYSRVNDAIWILGEIGDERAVETIVGLLHSKHDITALLALGSIGKPAVPALSQVIVAASDKDRRKNVAKLLGQIGDPGAIPALNEALNDQDKGVRKEAEKALKRCEKRA